MVANRQMGRGITIVSMALALSALAFTGWCQYASRAPSAVTVDALRKRCIFIEGSDTHPSQEFLLRNPAATGATLEFRGASCGCNQVSVGGKELKRGDTITISGKGQTALMVSTNNTTVGGHSYRLSLLQHLTAGTQELQLIFDVAVLPRFAIRPSATVIELRGASAPIHRQMEIEFSYRRGDNLTPSLHLTGTPSFVSLKEVEPPSEVIDEMSGVIKRRWIVSLEVWPENALGPNEYEVLRDIAISIRDGDRVLHAGQHRVLLRQVNGIIAPRTVNLGVVSRGQSVHRRFLMRSASKKPFQVQHAIDDNAFVRIAPVADTASDKHWMELTFLAEESGSVRQVVALHTSDAEFPVVELLIVATVK